MYNRVSHRFVKHYVTSCRSARLTPGLPVTYVMNRFRDISIWPWLGTNRFGIVTRSLHRYSIAPDHLNLVNLICSFIYYHLCSTGTISCVPWAVIWTLQNGNSENYIVFQYPKNNMKLYIFIIFYYTIIIKEVPN